VTELLYFSLDDTGDGDASIAVEVDAAGYGYQEAGPGERVFSSETLDRVLARGRQAVESALREFRDMDVAPDSIEIEVGLKLSVEAGVVLAKSTSDCHFLVKLAWRSRTD
jgi:hypothetical protein